jgi:methionyl-tRNA formyltransferase
MQRANVRFVLACGGNAGKEALETLGRHFPANFGGFLWDHSTGALPVAAAAFVALSEDDCPAGSQFLLCSGFGRILGRSVLERFEAGAYNAHPSLLPKYRGRHPIQWAIDQGETTMGVTVHRMTDKVDQGQIVAERSFQIGVEDAYWSIARKLSEIAAELLVDVAGKLVCGLPLFAYPASGLEERVWPRRTPADGQISWKSGSRRVIDRIRACAPKYPAYGMIGEDAVKFVGFKMGGTPGEVLVSTDEGCLIATGDGAVWLVPDRRLSVGTIVR